MAKITEESREQFRKEADCYKKRIEESLEKEKNILSVLK